MPNRPTSPQSRATPFEHGMLWLWVLVCLVGTTALMVYTAGSARVSSEAWSEAPGRLGTVVFTATGIAWVIWYWAHTRPALRALNRTLMSGALAATVGSGLFGVYTFWYSSATLASGAAAPQVGVVAPDFEIVDPQGEAWSLARVKGRTVLLTFYRGHW